jgi:hypothetical protein
MPYHLELGSEGHSFHGKAIVVNSRTGEHKSAHPIDLADAKAQMRLLESKSTRPLPAVGPAETPVPAGPMPPYRMKRIVMNYLNTLRKLCLPRLPAR